MLLELKMLGSKLREGKSAVIKRRRMAEYLSLALLCALFVLLCSCVPSEEEIMHRNKRTVLEHLDIEERKAEKAVMAMQYVGVGEIKKFELESRHNYGTSFFITDHLGYTYYMTLDWVDGVGMIFEEPSGRVLFDYEHGVARKRGEE